MIGTITRTGRMVPFGEISIGSPFFYMERFWVRTARTAGTELHSTNVSRRTQQNISSCSFEDRGDETPWDEDAKGWLEVEEVELVFLGEAPVAPVTTEAEMETLYADIERIGAERTTRVMKLDFTMSERLAAAVLGIPDAEKASAFAMRIVTDLRVVPMMTERVKKMSEKLMRIE